MSIAFTSKKSLLHNRPFFGRVIILGIFMGLVYLFISTQPVDGAAESPSKDPNVTKLTLKEAGLKFQKMRSLKGHFNGGTWNPQVDQWMGSKHRLMMHIAQLIQHRPTTESELESILGSPDDRLEGGDYFFRLIKTLPDNQRFMQAKCSVWVYQWRGNHDVLFFVSQSGSIQKTAWWYAGE